jgi:hypothetical protein
MSSPSPITAVLVISNLEYGGAQRQVVELTNNTDPRRMRIVLVSLSDYVPLAKELKDPKTLDICSTRTSRCGWRAGWRTCRSCSGPSATRITT